MAKLKLNEWICNHEPSERMLYKEGFLKTYKFWTNHILGLFENTYIRDFNKRTEYINSFHDIIGTHWSKSIEHPVLKITYKDAEIVFRYNFYDYEVAVISNKPLNITMNGLFKSKNESFFYQGFPEEYKLTERYEDNKKKFMAYIDNDYKFYTFMYLVKQELDSSEVTLKVNDELKVIVKPSDKSQYQKIVDYDITQMYPNDFYLDGGFFKDYLNKQYSVKINVFTKNDEKGSE